MSRSIHNVFVYGTLMQGYHNHGLLAESNYIGDAFTEERFTMYSLGGGGIPGVVDPDAENMSETYHIHGELYRVTPTTLRRLDMLEGHPDVYCREEVEIIDDIHDLAWSAWMYFWTYDIENSIIPTENKLSHGSWRSHNPPPAFDGG